MTILLCKLHEYSAGKEFMQWELIFDLNFISLPQNVLQAPHSLNYIA